MVEPHPSHIQTASEPHPKQRQKLREKWFLAIPAHEHNTKGNELRWPGDSQCDQGDSRESIRTKNKKDSKIPKKTIYFHTVRAICANRLKPAIIGNLLGYPKRDSQQGLRFRGPGRRSLGAKSQKVSKKSRKESSRAGAQKSEKSLEKGPKSPNKSEHGFSETFRTFFETFFGLLGPGRGRLFSRLF